MLRAFSIFFILLGIVPSTLHAAGGAAPSTGGNISSGSPTDAQSKAAATGAQGAANSTASSSGSTLGSASRGQNGGMDVGLRNSVNGATAAAMGQSAYVDHLYTSGQINKQDWLKLKAGMTQSMMGEVKKAQEGDVPLRSMNEPNAPQKTLDPIASTPNRPADERQMSLAPTAPSRTPSSIPVSDPFEARADEQVLDLQSGGSTVFISTGGVDSRPTETPKATLSNSDIASSEDLRDAIAISGQALVNGAGENERVDDAVTNYEKAALLAQKLLQEHKAKLAAKGKDGKPAGEKEDDAESFRRAHARAMLSLQGLKKVKRVQESGDDGLRAPIQFSPEQVVSAVTAGRSPSSVINSPWDKKDSAFAEDGLSNISLLFMALLGLFAGLASAYTLFMRPQKALVQLMVPGSGEHFTIRAGKKDGQFILDIMDVRGNLVRTAGMLRPQSVARAAVLPPELAARLGAKGPFDRFEFIEGEFVRTDKEEGYQVFPFEL